MVNTMLANVCKQNVTRFHFEVARLAVDRPDVDDAPDAALAHALDDAAAAVEARGEVGLEHLVPAVEVHAVQGPVPGDPGVVHQDLDVAAEVLLDLGDA